VLARLQKMGCELDAMLASVDPALFHPRDAVAMLEAASALEQRAASLKTLVADRAADAGTWSREGHRSPEAWLSQKTATSYGAAAATLEASAKLPSLPAVAAALRSGALSAPQLQHIAPAATTENEARLLGAAARENVDALRKTCAKEQARARSAEEERARHERVHRERSYRSWTDADGAYRFEARPPPWWAPASTPPSVPRPIGCSRPPMARAAVNQPPPTGPTPWPTCSPRAGRQSTPRW
jgi:hypothetical protein